MPPIEQSDCHDIALRWCVNGVDRNGQRTVRAEPEEVNVRWMRLRKQVVQPDGTTCSSDVQIISQDTVMNVGDLFWLGTMCDLDGTGTGTCWVPTSDLYELIVDDTARDIKGRVARLEYALMRYNDRLPVST